MKVVMHVRVLHDAPQVVDRSLVDDSCDIVLGQKSEQYNSAW